MASTPSARDAPGEPGPRLRVAFLLLGRFTLCAFANFVDVLRLAADEGDRSRPILCEWTILSDTPDPVASSCGVAVRPDARLGDPSGFDYVVVVGGLLSEPMPLSWRGFGPFISARARPTVRRASTRPCARSATVIGLFKTEVIHRRGPWRSFETVEFATLDWVDWFNHRRLLEPIGHVPPAEAEARYYAQAEVTAVAA